jgi:hypothetical protein
MPPISHHSVQHQDSTPLTSLSDSESLACLPPFTWDSLPQLYATYPDSCFLPLSPPDYSAPLRLRGGCADFVTAASYPLSPAVCRSSSTLHLFLRLRSGMQIFITATSCPSYPWRYTDLSSVLYLVLCSGTLHIIMLWVGGKQKNLSIL